MTDNLGYSQVPTDIIALLDQLVTTSYKLGKANAQEANELERKTLQSHEDAAYDVFLANLDKYIAQIKR
jgi:hypothetical protein